MSARFYAMKKLNELNHRLVEADIAAGRDLYPPEQVTMRSPKARSYKNRICGRKVK